MTDLITTAGGVSSNSYASLAYASSYFTTHVFGSTWATYSTALQQESLIHATRMLDDYVSWKGYKYQDTQALRWPRYSVLDVDGYDIDYDVIPIFLQQATCELASYLRAQKAAGSDPTAAPDTKGYKMLKVGDLQLEVDKDDRDRGSVLPDPVVIMLEPYGLVRTRSGPSVVKLSRA